MNSTIRHLWRRLNANIHPDDAVVFKEHRHTFNLDFPPPAFIGDVDNAPVVVLLANGGYDRIDTPKEFRGRRDHQEYIDWIRGVRTAPPSRLSSYYTHQKIYPLVLDGRAVIINAVAYRSPHITHEPENLQVADMLPSTQVHRRWCKEELLPSAASNERLVVAHRYRLWRLGESPEEPQCNLLISRNPASPYLSDDVWHAVSNWLTDRKPIGSRSRRRASRASGIPSAHGAVSLGLHGKYRVINAGILQKKAENRTDPRHTYYAAILSAGTYEAYFAQVGGLQVTPESYVSRPVTARMEIKYARKNGWIVDVD